jgi:hypothetical protein
MTTTIDGITCPSCGATARQVLESRRLMDRVRRRCVCSSCSERFTTYELRYDQITARVDAVAATRAAKLLDRFQALEHAMATLRQHLEKELNVTEVMEIPDLEAEPPTCEQCIHWDAERCDLGHPDPQDEGIVFARWCASFKGRVE